MIMRLVVFVLVFLLVGCDGGGGTNRPGDTNDPPPDPIPNASLVPPDSQEAFTGYLKKGLALWSGVGTAEELSEVTGLVSSMIDLDGAANIAVTADATVPLSSASPGGASIESFSRTNVQVQGVDEHDLVKFNGSHIYIAAGDSIDVVSAGIEPASTENIGSLRVSDNSNIQGLYLLGADGDLPPLLTAVSTLSYYQWSADWAQPWGWQQGKTRIHLFDVSSPEEPSAVTELTLDGYLINSRRIGDSLYLVTRYTPSLQGLIPYPTQTQEVASNQQIIEAADIGDLLPQVTVTGASPVNLVAPESCFLPATAEEINYPTLVTLSAIDLRNPGEVTSICMADNVDGIYVSLDAVYLTSTDGRFGDVVTILPVPPAGELDEFRNQSRTIVHKFQLTDLGPAYRGSGVVPGTFQNDPSYLMGEHEGVLAIVTSGSWNGDHRLTLLRESVSQEYQLEEAAHLPNDVNPSPIGKEGERIYASRIIGGRAYIVTFRTIDPVYVIDLSDPVSPEIVGELEIPGYSAYLHPVSDDLLLGIGKDAIVENDVAWYQGLNLRLFDVSDPANPISVSEVRIGLRGTESAVLYDPHALAYLPDFEENLHRFAIPVTVHGANQQADPEASVSNWYNFSYTGLHLFEIDAGDTPSLSRAGVVTSIDQYQCWNGSDRAFINGSAVYYVHGERVLSADWPQPDLIQTTELHEPRNYCYEVLF
jgi:uncharacterized secreted protein with C-terminal beta-propeller domain